MAADPYSDIFTAAKLQNIFPNDRADRFFEALLGDPDEGAYDIALRYRGFKGRALQFEFQLKQRPGKCLSCSLTYGLPHVFSRHPVIDLSGVVKSIDQLLNGEGRCGEWRIDRTREVARDLHSVPLTICLIDR
jgi:hypothetical protein